MTNGIEKYEPQSIADINEYAKYYVESRMFPDVQSVAQAFVKITAGRELGLLPYQSMNGVDVIKGKTVLKPALLRGLLDNHPDYDYDITWETDAATVTVYKNGKKRGDSRFSMDDARKAGLAGKDNYQKFERNMLLERATSNAIRWYAPGLTMGPAYVTGEITHDLEAIIPEGVKAKPRTRVTAEVIHTAPEDLEIVAEELPPLRRQLSDLSLQARADLYRLVGIEKGTKLADVKALLIAAADELGLAFTEEPNALMILDAANRREAAGGSAEAFEIFAKTGQDIDEGDQVEFDEVMT